MTRRCTACGWTGEPVTRMGIKQCPECGNPDVVEVPATEYREVSEAGETYMVKQRMGDPDGQEPWDEAEDYQQPLADDKLWRCGCGYEGIGPPKDCPDRGSTYDPCAAKPADDKPDVVADWRAARKNWIDEGMLDAGDALAQRVAELEKQYDNAAGKALELEAAQYKVGVETGKLVADLEKRAEAAEQRNTDLEDDRAVWMDKAEAAERKLEVAKRYITIGVISPRRTEEVLAEIEEAK